MGEVLKNKGIDLRTNIVHSTDVPFLMSKSLCGCADEVTQSAKVWSLV